MERQPKTLQICVYDGPAEEKEKPILSPIQIVSVWDPVYVESAPVASLSYAPRAPSPFDIKAMFFVKLPA